jgi:formylglycine-generating enzyme required for sulfatase activity
MDTDKSRPRRIEPSPLAIRFFIVSCVVALSAGCRDDRRPDATTAPAAAPPAPIPGMVLLPGGEFFMGTDGGNPAESPRHAVVVRPFYIDKTDVTVAEFARFIAATGHQTEDETKGNGEVFDLDHAKWEVPNGVTWRCPDKPGVAAPADEPVTQVSWNDATAYAKWAGKRLPTEAEFEYAARGGLAGKQYSWGDDLRPGGKPAANWWQGEFPTRNTGEDGYVGRSPVGKFPANGFGLFDMTGNVWQWCADWADDDYYGKSPRDNPTGPEAGTDRVIRGGSFLCAENFCRNYRVAGRSRTTPDSALNNLGFRCVKDAK